LTELVFFIETTRPSKTVKNPQTGEVIETKPAIRKNIVYKDL